MGGRSFQPQLFGVYKNTSHLLGTGDVAVNKRDMVSV